MKLKNIIIDMKKNIKKGWKEVSSYAKRSDLGDLALTHGFISGGLLGAGFLITTIFVPEAMPITFAVAGSEFTLGTTIGFIKRLNDAGAGLLLSEEDLFDSKCFRKYGISRKSNIHYRMKSSPYDIENEQIRQIDQEILNFIDEFKKCYNLFNLDEIEDILNKLNNESSDIKEELENTEKLLETETNDLMRETLLETKYAYEETLKNLQSQIENVTIKKTEIDNILTDLANKCRYLEKKRDNIIQELETQKDLQEQQEKLYDIKERKIDLESKFLKDDQTEIDYVNALIQLNEAEEKIREKGLLADLEDKYLEPTPQKAKTLRLQRKAR